MEQNKEKHPLNYRYIITDGLYWLYSLSNKITEYTTICSNWTDATTDK